MSDDFVTWKKGAFGLRKATRCELDVDTFHLEVAIEPFLDVLLPRIAPFIMRFVHSFKVLFDPLD